MTMEPKGVPAPMWYPPEKLFFQSEIRCRGLDPDCLPAVAVGYLLGAETTGGEYKAERVALEWADTWGVWSGNWHGYTVVQILDLHKERAARRFASPEPTEIERLTAIALWQRGALQTLRWRLGNIIEWLERVAGLEASLRGRMAVAKKPRASNRLITLTPERLVEIEKLIPQRFGHLINPVRDEFKLLDWILKRFPNVPSAGDWSYVPGPLGATGTPLQDSFIYDASYLLRFNEELRGRVIDRLINPSAVEQHAPLDRVLDYEKDYLLEAIKMMFQYREQVEPFQEYRRSAHSPSEETPDPELSDTPLDDIEKLTP